MQGFLLPETMFSNHLVARQAQRSGGRFQSPISHSRQTPRWLEYPGHESHEQQPGDGRKGRQHEACPRSSPPRQNTKAAGPHRCPSSEIIRLQLATRTPLDSQHGISLFDDSLRRLGPAGFFESNRNLPEIPKDELRVGIVTRAHRHHVDVSARVPVVMQRLGMPPIDLYRLTALEDFKVHLLLHAYPCALAELQLGVELDVFHARRHDILSFVYFRVRPLLEPGALRALLLHPRERDRMGDGALLANECPD